MGRARLEEWLLVTRWLFSGRFELVEPRNVFTETPLIN